MCTEYARKILSEFVIEADTGVGARNGTKVNISGVVKIRKLISFFLTC